MARKNAPPAPEQPPLIGEPPTDAVATTQDTVSEPLAPPVPPEPPAPEQPKAVKRYRCKKECRFLNRLWNIGDPYIPTMLAVIPDEYFEPDE